MPISQSVIHVEADGFSGSAPNVTVALEVDPSNSDLSLRVFANSEGNFEGSTVKVTLAGPIAKEVNDSDRQTSLCVQGRYPDFVLTAEEQISPEARLAFENNLRSGEGSHFSVLRIPTSVQFENGPRTEARIQCKLPSKGVRTDSGTGVSSALGFPSVSITINGFDLANSEDAFSLANRGILIRQSLYTEIINSTHKSQSDVVVQADSALHSEHLLAAMYTTSAVFWPHRSSSIDFPAVGVIVRDVAAYEAQQRRNLVAGILIGLAITLSIAISSSITDFALAHGRTKSALARTKIALHLIGRAIHSVKRWVNKMNWD